MKTRIYLTLLIAIIFCSNLYAQDKIDYKLINPFSRIGQNSVDCFSGYTSLYHIGGLAATVLIIYSGADYKVHNYFFDNTGVDKVCSPAVTAGQYMPVVLGLGFLGYGIIGQENKEYAAGCAVLQAAGVALVYTSLLKAITGRPHPDRIKYDDNSESKYFRFGFGRGGIYAGWPSGHLLVNTASVTSLLYFYKDNVYLDIAGGLYLGYLFAGVISHHQSTMHWFSEIVCGTLMGYAIGSTIGRDFRSIYDNSISSKSSTGSNFRITPDVLGVNFGYSF